MLPALVLASTEPEGTVTEAVTEGGRERGGGAHISYYLCIITVAYIVDPSYLPS